MCGWIWAPELSKWYPFTGVLDSMYISFLLRWKTSKWLVRACMTAKWRMYMSPHYSLQMSCGLRDDFFSLSECNWILIWSLHDRDCLFLVCGAGSHHPGKYWASACVWKDFVQILQVRHLVFENSNWMCYCAVRVECQGPRQVWVGICHSGW